ncbi:hypothetical protein GpartN1_g6654.t1 [Galdieria partita]|uniref:Uncharacterized protein n=1 Tax=Galdieria partita TaxID=83374 RepID=A0A9C7UN59_9RHOD|nr:hypothetical protein GpartN1_g937.t1 [Galdieria partita]GJQ14863.1 hypothetical protein GpartN1_g6654.t1 [Galdieria partita]
MSLAFVSQQVVSKPCRESFLKRRVANASNWYLGRFYQYTVVELRKSSSPVLRRGLLCCNCQKGKRELEQNQLPIAEVVRCSRTENNIMAQKVFKTGLTEVLKLVQFLKKPVGAIFLSLLLVLSSLDPVFAARSSGRIGGSQFSAPRVAPSPRSSYEYRGGGTGMGSFYSPFPATPIIPFGGFYSVPLVAPFGFGTFMMFLFVAGTILPRLRRNISESGESEEDIFNAPVTICELKIGLLSSARYLQEELENLAENADTSSKEGLFYVLNETILALLRHPEYWCYAAINKKVTKWSEATAEFNRKSIESRSNAKSETMSNYNNRRMRREQFSVDNSSNFPGEFILVHLIVATEGKLPQLPSDLNSESDVKEALKILSSTWSDKLQGLEVIWVPQAVNDVLTENEMVLQHPELRRIS